MSKIGNVSRHTQLLLTAAFFYRRNMASTVLWLTFVFVGEKGERDGARILSTSARSMQPSTTHLNLRFMALSSSHYLSLSWLGWLRQAENSLTADGRIVDNRRRGRRTRKSASVRSTDSEKTGPHVEAAFEPARNTASFIFGRCLSGPTPWTGHAIGPVPISPLSSSDAATPRS